MEDAELYSTLRKQCGRMRQLRPYIVSSPRRYEQLGPVRTTSYYLLILALYITGARIDFLQRIYQRLIGGSLRRTHSLQRAGNRNAADHRAPSAFRM